MNFQVLRKYSFEHFLKNLIGSFLKQNELERLWHKEVTMKYIFFYRSKADGCKNKMSVHPNVDIVQVSKTEQYN